MPIRKKISSHQILYWIARIALLTGCAAAILTLEDPDMESVSHPIKTSTFLTMLLSGIAGCGLVAGLGGFIASSRSNIDREKQRIVPTLFALALAAFGLSIATASLNISQLDTYFFDITDRVSQFLGTFLDGLLYMGVIAGFAIIITLRAGKEGSGGTAWVVSFYIAAIIAFSIGIANGILFISDLGDYASGTGKATFFLIMFLDSGIMYGGILAGLGVYISSLLKQNRAQITCHNCGKFALPDWSVCPFCGQALVTIKLGAHE